MLINSRSNQYIKKIRSLKDKKFRDEFNLYLVEGVKLVREVLSLSLPIESIIATEDGFNKLAVAVNENLVTKVTESVFESISNEVTPQGVLAVVKKQISEKIDNGASVFLDGVADPGNVGAIIRTAAASGYKNVYLAHGSADAYSPKSVRASMGGIFKVNIIEGEREQLIKKIKEPIVVADMLGKNLFEFEKGEYCLVIGNEGNGVSEQLKKIAQHIVSIPMQNGMESLNASVSAGILMYALKK
jgi:TrmH family RNA methyltransferase